jgi:hypothetical protein
MRNTASAFYRARDAQSGEQTATNVEEETRKLLSCRNCLAALGTASKTQKDMARKHAPKIHDAFQDLMHAITEISTRIQQGKFPPELAKRLASAGNSYQKAMAEFGEQTNPLDN